HAAGAEDADAAALGIDPDVDVLVATDAPVCGLDGLFDRSNELFAGDLLLRVQLEEGADEVSTHHAPPSCRIGPLKTKRGGHPRLEAAGLVPAEYTPECVEAACGRLAGRAFVLARWFRPRCWISQPR